MPGRYNQITWKYNQEPPAAYEGVCVVSYNYPGWTYNNPGGVYSDCGGADPGPSNYNLQMRACIRNTVTKGLDMRAYITGTFKFQMRARISRRQGWPIPDTGDPGIEGFTDTRLRMLARISIPSVSSQTLQMKGKIRLGGLFDLDMKARIVAASNLQMRANITGRGSSRVTMQYDVSRTTQLHRRMVFYVPGTYSTQTIQSRAYITKRRSTKFTGHFLVVGGANSAKVSTYTASVSHETRQTLRIGGAIVKV
jgi:hypothetical protein